MIPRPIKVADLFCGAGGSSTGAQRALARLGLSMDLLCVNHWPVAIETHRLNHPEARHYCQDVATVRPRQAVPGGRLDLLMASPTCTHHSRARGGKPTSDQQRMDPWHVVTWLTELRVKRLIIENVPEFVEWGPIDERSGRPIKSRKGEYFRAWLSALEAVGMRWDWRILNAADYGDATTRERFFLIARSDGKRICWPEPTHAPDTLALGKLPWRPAREIIDWSIAGRSIFNRKRRLSPRTLARIYAGAVKFRWPDPFLVVLRNHMSGQSLDLPLPTIAAGGTHLGLAQPVIVNMKNGAAPRGAGVPLGTLTARAAHMALAQPFVMSSQAEGAPRSLEKPVPGMTTTAAPALIAPYYGSGSGLTCSSAESPIGTCTTKPRFALVNPTRDFDILFRMLQPHELAAAMGFTSVEASYEFTGKKADLYAQIGNAVPVNTAAALVSAVFSEAPRAAATEIETEAA